MTGTDMMKHIEQIIKTENRENVFYSDVKILKFLFDNCEIVFPNENRFFGRVNFETIAQIVIWHRTRAAVKELSESEFAKGHSALAYTGTWDFSHTTPEWDTLLDGGFVGIVERILEYKTKNPEKADFYNALLELWESIFGFLKRSATVAKNCGKEEIANGLLALTERAPNSLYEVMQLTIVYYIMQHIFEGTFLRTLGRLDSLFYPFFKKETEENAKVLMFDYFKEIDTLKAPSNIPFAIGGTDKEGNSLINPLSYLILETYRKAGTNNTKFHILCAKNTPKDIIKQGLDAVREGNNSIVFMGDETLINCLKKHGIEHNDAVDYHVVGCYEVGARGELASTTNGRVNMPKALEYALTGGVDLYTNEQVGLKNNKVFNSYEELYDETLRQLEYLCRCSMLSTDIFEKNYCHIHSSPILSSTYLSALEKGGDLYCEYTAKYPNSSVNAMGLATLTDSLVAVKRLCFEDKTLTLEELINILKNDWEGNEQLRLFVKNRFEKFGTANPKVDAIAQDLVKALEKFISGKPNSKGGIWKLGMFSLNWRWEFGAKTAATPNGRKKGETISQNASATFGCDKNGATAHLLSIASLDGTAAPGGIIADIDLHSSAVEGENGAATFYAALMTFLENGGFGVHYNVLNTEVLKEARNNPDAYPNLQVRLCGWNVLFNTLSDKEKDEYIERSIK